MEGGCKGLKPRALDPPPRPARPPREREGRSLILAGRLGTRGVSSKCLVDCWFWSGAEGGRGHRHAARGSDAAPRQPPRPAPLDTTLPSHSPTPKEKLNAIIEHVEFFEKINKESFKRNNYLKNFDSLKKHFHSYAKGFDGAKELREQLMKTKNVMEVKALVKSFLENML